MRLGMNCTLLFNKLHKTKIMKKTVSVNIKGINFLIEEDAYETLERYLNRLKQNLHNQEGADEIVEDIEIRIAELCSKKLDDTKEVVELQDIQSILETLGDPAQFIDDDNEKSSHKEQSDYSEYEYTHSKKEKRLFRDTDNAQIAGVCQGIANFFNIDVVIIRVVWALIFFFGGFGFLLYVILWIVVPKANTSIDRLRMKGKPITVENVREEVEQAADKIKKGSKKFANNLRNEDSYSNHINMIGRFITVAFGLFFILMAVGQLIAFLVFILGGFQFIPAKTDTGFLSLTQIGELVLSNPGDVSTAWIGGLMVSISSILFCFLLGFFLIVKMKSKWTKLTLWGLFTTGVIGLIICISLGIRTGRDMTISGEIEKTIGHIDTEQLVILPINSVPTSDPNLKIKSTNRPWLTEIKGNDIYESEIRFSYKESKDSLFHVYETAECHAHTVEKAVKRAKNIRHEVNLVGDTLSIGTNYHYPKSDKFRNQQVRMIIEIPKDKTVLFNGTIIKLGDDDFYEEDSDYPKEYGRLHNDGSYGHYD